MDDHSRRELFRHTVVRSLHADRIAERITELGGSPNYHSPLVGTEPGGSDLGGLARAERAALAIEVQHHRELIGRIGSSDARTKLLLEEIVDEEQALLVQAPAY